MSKSKVAESCPCGAEFLAHGKGKWAERRSEAFQRRHKECRVGAQDAIREARPIMGFTALADEDMDIT